MESQLHSSTIYIFELSKIWLVDLLLGMFGNMHETFNEMK